MEKEILVDLGLTNNEVEVYLSLLTLGSATVNDIAKKVGLHRQAVYDALERMLDKGFANYVTKNNVRYFKALHPNKIIDYLDEKKRSVEMILPELINMTKKENESTNVELFKGKMVVRTFFRENLKEIEKTKSVPLINGIEDLKFYEKDNIALEKYLMGLRRLNIKENVLVAQGEKFFVKGEQTHYKQLPKEYFSSLPMSIVGNKVFTLVWGEPDHLIVIENPQFAEASRKKFNALWRIAKSIYSVS